MGIDIKEPLKKIRRKILYHQLRKKLTNKNFTIISNNCWGGHVYQDLGLEYMTPFVGMFLYAQCYLKLLKNLDYYLTQDLIFISESKYEEANNKRKNAYYPIALLDDIELHMVHYKTEDEAYCKWNRRKSRMNMNNLFIKLSAPNHLEYEVIKEFDNLAYQNKIIFTSRKLPCIKYSVYIENMDTDKEMNRYMEYFDAVSWLNEGVLLRR